MKKFTAGLIVAGIILFICSCQNLEKSETVFFCDFNLGTTVKKLNIDQLREQTGRSDFDESFGETIQRRRSFAVEYIIEEKDDNRFNEEVFLRALIAEVEWQTAESNIRQEGAGYRQRQLLY